MFRHGYKQRVVSLLLSLFFSSYFSFICFSSLVLHLEVMLLFQISWCCMENRQEEYLRGKHNGPPSPIFFFKVWKQNGEEHKAFVFMWLFMRNDCCYREGNIIVEFAVYGHQMCHRESDVMWGKVGERKT